MKQDWEDGKEDKAGKAGTKREAFLSGGMDLFQDGRQISWQGKGGGMHAPAYYGQGYPGTGGKVLCG